MPLFHHKSAEEKEAEEELKRRQAEAQALQGASLESLQRGGIPIQAQRRLDDLQRQEGRFFTSDLSVNEFLLARQSGFRPITQVTGSSVYHVGWQRLPMYTGSRELEVVTRALNHARELALGRMTEEAQRVGADAVIGVHIKRGDYEWAEDLIEFNAIGTAVRLDGAGRTEHPGLTNLSGQDFWKLHQAGFWPVGVVGASTVYYVVASWQTRMAGSFWGSWANQELEDFTWGLYTARHLAMGRASDQATRLGGGGMVGIEIEQEEEEYEVDLGNDQERTDMIFTFHVLGTAIAPMREAADTVNVTTAVNLRS